MMLEMSRVTAMALRLSVSFALIESFLSFTFSDSLIDDQSFRFKLQIYKTLP